MQLHSAPFILKEIKLEVTHECQLYCTHCSSHAGGGNTVQIAWEDCVRVLNEAGNMGIEEVAFSGGEPLLWKPLPDAIELSKRKGFLTSLYTTGVAEECERLFGTLKKSGLDRIIFSIYADDGYIHDKTTGLIGSFNKTISAIENAVLEGLSVEFHFVPMRHNHSQLEKVANLAQELGVHRVSVLRLVPQGRGKGGTLGLTREENIELRKTISTLRAEGMDIRVGSPYNIFMLRDNASCSAAIDKVTISPELYVYPCDAFKQIKPESFGVDATYCSLQGNSLKTVWEKSTYLNAVRSYLTTPFASTCAACNVLSKCLSGCVAQKIYATGFLAKSPDPMCLKGKGSKIITLPLTPVQFPQQ